MSGRSTRCIDCGTTPPEEASGHTATGWRLRKTLTADAPSLELEWRCISCWRKFKAAELDELPKLPPYSDTG
jgi:hypothetical protein